MIGKYISISNLSYLIRFKAEHTPDANLLMRDTSTRRTRGATATRQIDAIGRFVHLFIIKDIQKRMPVCHSPSRRILLQIICLIETFL